MKNHGQEWTLVDINMADNDGNTALHNAARAGDINKVKDLVKAGADILLTNNEGKTAKQVAIDNKITPIGRVYNAVALRVGGSSYEDTQQVYEYLDKMEIELAKNQVREENKREAERARAEAEEARAEAERARGELEAEKLKIALNAAGEEQIENDRRMEREADLEDDLEIKPIRSQIEDEHDIATLEVDLKKLNDEFEAILANQAYKRDPNKPAVELSEEEYSQMERELTGGSALDLGKSLLDEHMEEVKRVALGMKGKSGLQASASASVPTCTVPQRSKNKLTRV